MSASAAVALEREGVPFDPLEIACSTGSYELADWRIVGGIPGLTVFVAGSPLAGLVLCYDRGDERECVRLHPDGTVLARVVARRKVTRLRPPLQRLEAKLDAITEIVDRRMGSGRP